jgi:DNA adenine methylase
MGLEKVNSLTPILKWAGGKRWLFGRNENLFPDYYHRLVEPFAGGAAVFFHLAPARAWLNDINVDLVDTYKAIAEDWEGVVRLLRIYHSKHSTDFYYLIRASEPRSLTGRAAKFIYLNRTCFNGLYRVNLKGEFNVPIGTKTAVLMPDDDFPAVSDRLKKAKLTTWDFEKVIDEAEETDFIFADPPYTVRHNINGFIKYNEKLFSWADQVRLRDALLRASGRGVHVVLSNADHESIHELYRGCQEMKVATRQSVMAASSGNRKVTTELLIRV